MRVGIGIAAMRAVGAIRPAHGFKRFAGCVFIGEFGVLEVGGHGWLACAGVLRLRLTELRALARDDVDPAEALDHLAETGLPLLVCEVDQLGTDATGDHVFAYQLSDHLEISLGRSSGREAQFGMRSD